MPTPQESGDRLVELTLEGGGPGNVTCLVADVVNIGPQFELLPMVAGAAAR